MPKLQATRSFSGPDGNFDKHDQFEASADRADWLKTNGFAVDVPEEAPTGETVTTVTAPDGKIKVMPETKAGK